jgi:hypothetical protein
MTGLKIYGNDAGVKEGEGKEIITGVSFPCLQIWYDAHLYQANECHLNSLKNKRNSYCSALPFC